MEGQKLFNLHLTWMFVPFVALMDFYGFLFSKGHFTRDNNLYSIVIFLYVLLKYWKTYRCTGISTAMLYT